MQQKTASGASKPLPCTDDGPQTEARSSPLYDGSRAKYGPIARHLKDLRNKVDLSRLITSGKAMVALSTEGRLTGDHIKILQVLDRMTTQWGREYVEITREEFMNGFVPLGKGIESKTLTFGKSLRTFVRRISELEEMGLIITSHPPGCMKRYSVNYAAMGGDTMGCKEPKPPKSRSEARIDPFQEPPRERASRAAAQAKAKEARKEEEAAAPAAPAYQKEEATIPPDVKCFVNKLAETWQRAFDETYGKLGETSLPWTDPIRRKYGITLSEFSDEGKNEFAEAMEWSVREWVAIRAKAWAHKGETKCPLLPSESWFHRFSDGYIRNYRDGLLINDLPRELRTRYNDLKLAGKSELEINILMAEEAASKERGTLNAETIQVVREERFLAEAARQDTARMLHQSAGTRRPNKPPKGPLVMTDVKVDFSIKPGEVR